MKLEKIPPWLVVVVLVFLFSLGSFLVKVSDLFDDKYLNVIIRDESHIGWIAFGQGNYIAYVARSEKNYTQWNMIKYRKGNIPVTAGVTCDVGKMEMNMSSVDGSIHLKDNGRDIDIGEARYFLHQNGQREFSAVFFTDKLVKYPNNLDDLDEFTITDLWEILEKNGIRKLNKTE